MCRFVTKRAKDKLSKLPAERQEKIRQLLKTITPDKLHPEFETGSAVGNENW